MIKPAGLVLATLLALQPAALLADQGHQHGSPEKLGKVNFPTSCRPAAQEGFERGLALLHSFWFEQAEKAFRAAAAADPKCGIAWWGVAATYYHPLWEPPGKADLEAGAQAIAQAASVGAKTQRERDYTGAWEQFYKDYDQRGHAARAVAWSSALEQLHNRYPKDNEATIFYALSLIATEPPTDKTLARHRRAGSLLEPIFERQPSHPGVAHYIIHAYDAPPVAAFGVKAARRYAQIAPTVPHALHMPSHIFTRLGMWEDSIASNRAAASAGEAYARREHVTAGWAEALHALDYLMYAYLQIGQDAKARAVMEEARQIGEGDRSVKSSYPTAAIPARFALERRAWPEAAGLVADPNSSPVAQAISEWARALGAARAGDPQTAAVAVAHLVALRDQLQQQNDAYWSQQVEIQRQEAAAWLAFARHENNALDLMRAAADSEDASDKSPVTPGAVLPARELLADLELELGQLAEALKNYEASLKNAPRRFNSLYGAARAAEMAGDAARARAFYSQLADLCRNADTQRPALQQARTYLAQR